MLQFCEDNITPVPKLASKYPERYRYPVSAGTNVLALWDDGIMYGAEMKDFQTSKNLAEALLKLYLEADVVIIITYFHNDHSIGLSSISAYQREDQEKQKFHSEKE